MKNFSLLFIAFLFMQFTSLAQSGWIQQTSGTTVNLSSVHFISSDIGWAVGDAGTIIYTTDSGENWNPQNINTNDNLATVQFVDADNGWIVGEYEYNVSEGRLFRTTDGGLNWTDISDTLNTRSVYFIDEDTGWRGTRSSNNVDGYIFKTTDAGMSWIEQYGWLGGYFTNLQFIDSNFGWATSGHMGLPGSTGLLGTTNRGVDWTSLGGFVGKSFCFVDSLNGWRIDCNDHGTTFFNEIRNTVDGGYFWQQQLFQGWASLPTIFFVDIDKGWTAGDSSGVGIIWHSSNSGVDWISQDCGIVPPIYSIYFTDENNGWAVGKDGLILHTTTGGVVSVEGETSGIPNKYNLEQNFPNPFNPSTKIKYSNPQISNVIIKVFDILGNEIETLVNEEKPLGTFEITWNAEEYPSGVYFYHLKAGDFVETKKMVLMK